MRKNLFISFSFLLFSGMSFGQNPSDGCAGVPVLTVTTYCTPIAYSLPGSYSDGGLVTASCQAGQDKDDGWYAFVATNTTTDIWMNGNRAHTVSAWDACGGGTELACDSDNAGQTSTISFATVIGNTYYIQVHRNQSNNSSTMSGDICIHDPHPANQDCNTSVPICTATSLPGNSSGFNTQDLDATNNGCLIEEHQSSWYSVSFETGGTFQFTLSPDATDDYDFAVWGPGASCPPTTAPIRCSAGSGPGNTGINTALNSESPQTSEGPSSDKYVDDLVVLAGETYMILIDNFSASLSNFTLTFGGSASTTCVPLPVTLTSFTGISNHGMNVLSWTTKSETDNAYYTLERSIDGQNWHYLAKISGAGNSSEEIDYIYRDDSFSGALNYYRLTQTDYNGDEEEIGLITILNSGNGVEIVKIYNMMGEEVGPDYKGLKIYLYSDGTTIKMISSE